MKKSQAATEFILTYGWALLVAGSRRLNGALDELKIWNRALTQQEIQNAMISKFQ